MAVNKGFNMQKDFPEFINQEFRLRKERNSKYSVRAFANYLEINAGILSSLMNGKRKMGHKYIEKFGRKLGLSINEIKGYQANLSIKESITEDEMFKKYTQVTLDSYQLLSEWHHMAIIYMRTPNNYLKSPVILAKSLGLTKKQVSDALARLERMDIVTKTSRGYKVKSKAFITNIDSDLGKDAGRKFMRDILYKSLEALEHTDISKRDHSTITMSFPPKEMQNAKEMLKKFRRKFLTTFDRPSTKNEAYTLQLSFFPLTDQSNN